MKRTLSVVLTGYEAVHTGRKVRRTASIRQSSWRLSWTGVARPWWTGVARPSWTGVASSILHTAHTRSRTGHIFYPNIVSSCEDTNDAQPQSRASNSQKIQRIFRRLQIIDFLLIMLRTLDRVSHIIVLGNQIQTFG